MNFFALEGNYTGHLDSNAMIENDGIQSRTLDIESTNHESYHPGSNHLFGSNNADFDGLYHIPYPYRSDAWLNAFVENLEQDPRFRAPDAKLDYPPEIPLKKISHRRTTYSDLIERTPNIPPPAFYQTRIEETGDLMSWGEVELSPNTHGNLTTQSLSVRNTAASETLGLSQCGRSFSGFSAEDSPWDTATRAMLQDVSSHISTHQQFKGQLGEESSSISSTAPRFQGTQSSAPSKCMNCRLGGRSCKRKLGHLICDPCYEYLKSIYTTPQKNPQKPYSLYSIIFNNLADIQQCLVDIRREIEIHLRPRGPELQDSSQDISHDRIICHFSDSVIPNPFSDQSQPVVITRLATTSASRTLYNRCVPPALNSTQMNYFIDRQIQESLSPDLQSVNVGIIKIALRCASWFAVLFNLDKHVIYEPRRSSVCESQNLILNTLYSILYEAETLTMTMGHEVRASVLGRAKDPGTILCALYLLYRSIHHHQKLKWNSARLDSLKTFLSGFRERLSNALKALQRVKLTSGASYCGIQGEDMQRKKRLVEAQTKLRPVMTFTYEKTDRGLLGQTLGESSSIGRSYIDILEAETSWLEQSEQELTQSTTSLNSTFHVPDDFLDMSSDPVNLVEVSNEFMYLFPDVPSFTQGNSAWSSLCNFSDLFNQVDNAFSSAYSTPLVNQSGVYKGSWKLQSQNDNAFEEHASGVRKRRRSKSSVKGSRKSPSASPKRVRKSSQTST